jgi:hypothetical protein
VPVKYQNHTCSRLKEEEERLTARIKEVEASSEFNAVKVVSVASMVTIVYSPIALVLHAASPAIEERERLREERRDLKKVSIKKNCYWSRGQTWPM